SVMDTATTSTNFASSSVSGRMAFDGGLIASFELVPNVRFRSGLLYDQRPFDVKFTGGTKASFNFAYLDVPVNMQYNFSPMFGVFGGLIAAVKVSDSVDVPTAFAGYTPGMKSMYPLINVGGNFLFNDMIGLEAYYEMGMGDISDNAKNYSTFGFHFIYWL